MNKLEKAIKLAKITSFLEKYNIENYTVNKDFTVDVNGDVSLRDLNLYEIPVQFGRVSGYFDISYNKLTSLKGCPREVGGDFWICVNPLKNLNYSPKIVHQNYDCSRCDITSLEGCTKKIGGVLRMYNCAKLKTLNGCPRKIKSSFDCSNCYELESLEGCPEDVGGSFAAYECVNLKTLKYIPEKIKDALFLRGCCYIKPTDLKEIKNKSNFRIISDFFNGYLKDFKGA